MAESFVEDEVLAHRARNEKLREVIQQHGADLEERRRVDFFFYADDRAAAVALAGELNKVGFDAIHVADQDRDGKWSIQAVRVDSVATITEQHFVERVVRLCARYLAEFDGWGTAI